MGRWAANIWEECREFYKDRKVLITGHTGFKGSWLCSVLHMLDASVVGYSLGTPTEPNLYTIAGVDEAVQSVTGDIRDLKRMMDMFAEIQPEVVFHLAAQPIVRDSYLDPVNTYKTNVMGTVNVLECIKKTPSVRSFLNVTTDKVYENQEWEYGYRESDPLDGYDPYSNSKSCSELVTHSYARSFFYDRKCRISTSRAGNVIGGGDFANDRIIPDCVRAAAKKRKIVVRNPFSIRPYQYVLEPLAVYLVIAMRQYGDANYAGCYNVGPEDRDCVKTGQLVSMFCDMWGNGIQWENQSDSGPHEANLLKLDCSRIRRIFDWEPQLSIKEAVKLTVEWSKAWLDGKDMKAVTESQINYFFSKKE